ncbi:hypothetical protein B0H11DRAFT_1912198 [Mycena galericulata]|nr:hypothetical protein B0H11DRAFT_1912198 [Mycena galericulata]
MAAQDDVLRPIDAERLASLLEICANDGSAHLGESVSAARRPLRGLCLSLRSANTTRGSSGWLLRRRPVSPAMHPRKRAVTAVAHRCPSDIPAPVSPLSQPGARAFSAFLDNLGDESLLESLNVDFVWLDDALCEKIVDAGRKIQKQTLTTSGTKLSDKGIVSILEGCEALEELVLDEVRRTPPPPGLKTLRIDIAELGPHFGRQIIRTPFTPFLLGRFRLLILSAEKRHLPCIAASRYTIVPLMMLWPSNQPPPLAFLDRIKEQKSQMTSIRCDFWSLSIADIKLLRECSPKLEDCVPISTGSARVFMGHATGQTTGLGVHMAARFSPNVERESIDLKFSFPLPSP